MGSHVGTTDCALPDSRCPTLYDHNYAEDTLSQGTSHFRTVWNVHGRVVGTYFNLFRTHVQLTHTYVQSQRPLCRLTS